MDFEYYSKLFASHLDRLLKESEISVNECARLSGLSAGLISGLARGKINNPSLKTMVAIANLFDLPYSMFLKPYEMIRKNGRLSEKLPGMPQAASLLIILKENMCSSRE